MSASYWVGNVLGVFFITPLSDRFGRRMAMFFGSVVAVIGTALCTGAVEGEFRGSSSWYCFTSVLAQAGRRKSRQHRDTGMV
jgi:MFS family permease